ncbi:MAG: pyridoxamine 5'-phosphate oxidase family protein [Dehalococcoidia bacterium]
MREQEPPDRRAEPASDQPQMPKGYGLPEEVRDGATIAWTQVCEWLGNARNYWVATTRPDGRPHVMPVWGLWLDGTFHFSTDPDSRKGRNLAANPEGVVHLESGDTAVILEGTIHRVSDPAVLAPVLDAYGAKYGIRPDLTNPQYGFYSLRPRSVFTWLERDFTGSATRFRFDS